MNKQLFSIALVLLSAFVIQTRAQSPLVKAGNVTKGGVLAVKMFPPNTVIAYTSTAVYKSTDGGAAWTVIGDFFSNEPYQYTGLYAHSENRIFITHTGSGKVRYTNNGAKPWTEVSVGRNRAGSSLFFTDSLNGFLVINGNSGSTDTPYVYGTTDGGLTWTFKAKIPEVLYSAQIYFANSSKGWVWAVDRLYYTVDGGTTWTKSAYGDGTINNVQMVDEQTGYLAAYTNGLMKTTDGGATWTTLADISGWTAGDVYFFNTGTGYSVEFNRSNESRVRKTIDGGATWEVIATGEHVRKIAVADEQHMLFFGTNNNIWKLDGVTGLKETGQNIVSAVYPNPFDNALNITIDRPVQEARLMDVYGKEYALFTGLDEGIHMLSTDNLTGQGIYFLQLKDGSAIQTIRLIRQ
jgi:photosystem II stability/assembly factor-like uncharacterized protein